MALPSVAHVGHDLPDDEARFLAIGPQLARLLDEYDRLWAPSHAAYEAWWKAGEHLPRPKWPAMEGLPEWQVYSKARQPVDDLYAVVTALYEPFEDVRLTDRTCAAPCHRQCWDWAKSRTKRFSSSDTPARPAGQVAGSSTTGIGRIEKLPP